LEEEENNKIFKAEPDSLDRAKVLTEAKSFYLKNYRKELDSLDPNRDSNSFYDIIESKERNRDLLDILKTIEEGKPLDSAKDIIPMSKNSAKSHVENIKSLSSSNVKKIIQVIGIENIKSMKAFEEVESDFDEKMNDKNYNFSHLINKFEEILRNKNEEIIKESPENNLILSALAKILQKSEIRSESIEKFANSYDNNLKELKNNPNSKSDSKIDSNEIIKKESTENKKEDSEKKQPTELKNTTKIAEQKTLSPDNKNQNEVKLLGESATDKKQESEKGFSKLETSIKALEESTTRENKSEEKKLSKPETEIKRLEESTVKEKNVEEKKLSKPETEIKRLEESTLKERNVEEKNQTKSENTIKGLEESSQISLINEKKDSNSPEKIKEKDNIISRIMENSPLGSLSKKEEDLRNQNSGLVSSIKSMGSLDLKESVSNKSGLNTENQPNPTKESSIQKLSSSLSKEPSIVKEDENKQNKVENVKENKEATNINKTEEESEKVEKTTNTTQEKKVESPSISTDSLEKKMDTMIGLLSMLNDTLQGPLLVKNSSKNY
jgi:hypothetical protein